MRRYLTLIGLVVAVVAAGGVLAGTAAAVESGDTVQFLVPGAAASAVQPGARVVFLGQPIGTVDASGCTTGNFPVQRANIIVPGEGATGPVEVIVVSSAEPLEPGTRGSGVVEVAPSPCWITTGAEYRRFEGVVD